MSFITTANNKMSHLFDTAFRADPLSRGDIESAVWPLIANASVKGDLPNWIEIKVSETDARNGRIEDIAEIAAEAIRDAARSGELDTAGVAIICSVDRSAKVGSIGMSSDTLLPSVLRRKIAIAKAGGSAVVIGGSQSAYLTGECLWNGSKVELSPGTTVGCAPIRDVVLKCYGASHSHGVFTATAQGIRFEDSSTNGTELNGVRINGVTRDLVAGDTLTFAGGDTLVIRKESA